MLKKGLLLALFVSGLAWAQVASAMISGRVYNEERAPLANVKMTVRNLETGRTWSVLTGAEGKYLASRLPMGNYMVQASMANFSTEMQGVPLKNLHEVRLDFMLKATGNRDAGISPAPAGARSAQQPPTRQFDPVDRAAAGFAVQLAAYRTRPRAEGLRAMLQDTGYTAYVVESNIPQSGRYYRVRVGPFGSKEEAREIALNMQSRLSDLLPDFWIVSD